jgi:hypothetical protein
VSQSIYTLLIVESPVLAKVIQKKAPSSVYVISTDGFCWRPSYHAGNNSLKAVADPEKAHIRKEIKEQAKVAGNIIVAADSDPSGDFITWALAKFLNPLILKRGSIRHISKAGILQTVSETELLKPGSLEARLKNRFLVQNEWNRIKSLPPIQDAALAATFSRRAPYFHFLDEHEVHFESASPVYASPDEWIPVRSARDLLEYRVYKPLSTFNVIEDSVKTGITGSFSEAQILLQQLFQTTLAYSDESLISYPRTDANAFYSETWDFLRNQFNHIGSQNMLKPIFLQEIAEADEPHESIHPLNLELEPEKAGGELPKNIGQIYSLIYSQTLNALKMPEPINEPLVSDFHPDTYFYPRFEKGNKPDSLRPFFTVSDIGHQLKETAQMPASAFGKQMDQWVSSQFLTVKNGQVTPGRKLTPLLEQADRFHSIFNDLRAAKEQIELSVETVQQIITS